MCAPDVVEDRFEIERLAGSGGMGDVYRARDRLSGETVALKVLQRASARDLSRLSREAEALVTLQLPGVVQYVAHGMTGAGRPYLAMEWLDGVTLEERLAGGPLSIEQSVSLAMRVAATLGAVHRLGIVHRDLKPSNLMLVGGAVERATLLDFGLARDLQVTRSLTAPGAIVGTPGYMAPEQARGASSVDARADVFALGCMLFTCLAGRPPFLSDNVLALLMKVVLEDPPRLGELRDGVPAPLERLVARMLAKEPGQRPRDGAAVAEELATVAHAGLPAGGSVSTVPPGPGVEITTSERRVTALRAARPGARVEHPSRQRDGGPARQPLRHDAGARRMLASRPQGGAGRRPQAPRKADALRRARPRALAALDRVAPLRRRARRDRRGRRGRAGPRQVAPRLGVPPRPRGAARGRRDWTGRADPMAAGSAFGLLAHALRRAMGILDGEPIEARRRKVLDRVERLGGLGAKGRTSRRSSARSWGRRSPTRATCSSARRARSRC
ncbi:serine/threonine-protein kinase [Sorangium sp. So ce233]|uniref:serine/threonine-protein kinase n=1 Tax=Sorangium sp. So ce233 TaxID=3133290 RepID=UPI003F5EEA56